LRRQLRGGCRVVKILSKVTLRIRFEWQSRKYCRAVYPKSSVINSVNGVQNRKIFNQLSFLNLFYRRDKVVMITQSQLIGEHPGNPNMFAKWLKCYDHEAKENKKHRELVSKIDDDEEIEEWLGELMVQHHYAIRDIEKMSQILIDLGFPECFEAYRKLPNVDKTQKANFTEILLLEYILSCLNKELIFDYRLKYNPNVDQSMKGDDVLIIDLGETEGTKDGRIYLGEAKFRSQPDAAAINDIIQTLAKSKLPLSISFLLSIIGEENYGSVTKLYSRIVKEIHVSNDMIYVGMLLSDLTTSKKVDQHLHSDNPQMVFLSLSVSDPGKIVKKAFDHANGIISGATKNEN